MHTPNSYIQATLDQAYNETALGFRESAVPKKVLFEHLRTNAHIVECVEYIINPKEGMKKAALCRYLGLHVNLMYLNLIDLKMKERDSLVFMQFRDRYINSPDIKHKTRCAGLAYITALEYLFSIGSADHIPLTNKGKLLLSIPGISEHIKFNDLIELHRTGIELKLKSVSELVGIGINELLSFIDKKSSRNISNTICKVLEAEPLYREKNPENKLERPEYHKRKRTIRIDQSVQGRALSAEAKKISDQKDWPTE